MSEGVKGNYYITTWGCQMNDHDSEVLAGLLENMGYSPVSSEKEADIILLNTCCVREKAENKVYGYLGSLKHLKNRNQNLILAVCGCMVQQEKAAEEMRKKIPYVDIIFGTHNMHRLPDLIKEVRESQKPMLEVWKKAREVVEDLPVKRAEGLRGYVNITYGCNNYCTYCIVPYVRGRERSREPESIEKEVRGLAAEGCSEIMLLGQNVNAYGKHLDRPIDFADLLARLDTVDGIRRIRYMTSHPRDFSDKLIETIAASRHVCEHFHLPVQAGSNSILKKMHRGYTREEYIELTQKVRQDVPGASITTDIIVGFPGETEEDFLETLELVNKVRFDAAFTFIYSPRKGTPAAEMEDPVPLAEKKRWFNQLLEAQNKNSLESNKKLLGSRVEVLVEGVSKSDPGILAGHTRTNRTVVFPASEELANTYQEVRITRAQTWNLEGELV